VPLIGSPSRVVSQALYCNVAQSMDTTLLRLYERRAFALASSAERWSSSLPHASPRHGSSLLSGQGLRPHTVTDGYLVCSLVSHPFLRFITCRLVNKQTDLQFEYLNKLVSVRDFLSRYSNCRSVCLLTSLVSGRSVIVTRAMRPIETAMMPSMAKILHTFSQPTNLPRSVIAVLLICQHLRLPRVVRFITDYVT
jgi:hypothetical protein